MDGVDAGGILGLAGLIAGHQPETVADFRAIYGVSLWAVPLAEAWDLVQMLMRDPASRLHAAVAGWEFPVSREWMALTDLFDMQLSSKSRRKQKPYPRPFEAGKKSRIGGTKKVRRTPAELRALLALPRTPLTK